MRLLPAGRNGRLVLVGVVGLSAALAAWSAAAYFSRPPADAPLPRRTPPEFLASYPASPGADPYPECPAIREWLAARVKEPGSVEILSWEGRKVFERDTPQAKAGQVVVLFRARDRNRYGGKLPNPWTVILGPDGRPVSGGPSY
jgi:hypothetical protein